MTTHVPPTSRTLTLGSKRLVAAVFICFGMLLIAYGDWWASWFLSALAVIPGVRWLALVLPFLPMAVIGIGVVILSRS